MVSRPRPRRSGNGHGRIAGGSRCARERSAARTARARLRTECGSARPTGPLLGEGRGVRRLPRRPRERADPRAGRQGPRPHDVRRRGTFGRAWRGRAQGPHLLRRRPGPADGGSRALRPRPVRGGVAGHRRRLPRHRRAAGALRLRAGAGGRSRPHPPRVRRRRTGPRSRRTATLRWRSTERACACSGRSCSRRLPTAAAASRATSSQTGREPCASRSPSYDRSLPLVIDPTIDFTSYLGTGADEEVLWTESERRIGLRVRTHVELGSFPSRPAHRRPSTPTRRTASSRKFTPDGSDLAWSVVFNWSGTLAHECGPFALGPEREGPRRLPRGPLRRAVGRERLLRARQRGRLWRARTSRCRSCSRTNPSGSRRTTPGTRTCWARAIQPLTRMATSSSRMASARSRT